MSPGVHREADRDLLLDRLQDLRGIVPVFARELASARRQAARLRLENGRLLEQVRQLQHQRAGRDGARGGKFAAEAAHHTMSVHATKGVGNVQRAHTVARLG
jgi:hypothetical protein